MNYIDFHCHINITPLLEDLNGCIKDLNDNNVKVIVIGIDFETSKKAIEICEQFPDVCIGATIGQHPNDNPKEIFEKGKFLELLKNKKVVGIGECGLDYFRLKGTEEYILQEKSRQEILFKAHINLAKETSKMLMIHARPAKDSMDAYEKALDILEQENFTGKANFHFFVGDISVAERIVAHGWHVSFDGPVTFTNEYDKVIECIPLENIGCETDAPFAAPAPYRGQVCKPWMVKEVYKKIADIKKVPLEVVEQHMCKNAENLFTIFV